ncbi:MAG: DEAD/DEAH box helicase family protein [Candidatus Moranbacteria bacterium]|nr:DEAD/DEAH box helicase family protein [Candidatus Moranbacteria bacterium]
MKFKFSDNLQYQEEAIRAVVGLFDTGKNFVRASADFSLQSPGRIIGNELEIDEAGILRNLRGIQAGNGLEPAGEQLESLDFSVEMETGTGKTYVYLRTVFELYRAYGLTKFIVLVPSVAIREGVLKTLEQTREHFRGLYGIGYGAFAYDSAKLSQVREFAQSNDIQIMVMTVQSFAGNERLVMRQTPDRFHGERPIDLIAGTRPVVIMDEPQNMESDLAREAIADLRPLFRLRYSATHKDPRNLVYRLTPIDAYRMGLVKKIQVYGVRYIDPSSLVFVVRSIEIRNRKPTATVLVEKKTAGGDYAYSSMTLRAGVDLFRKTGRHEKYEGLFVSDVNKQYDFVELSNGEQYRAEADADKEDVFRAQVAETVKAHFLKQKELGDRVKVLSLFFIDRVDNYVEGGMLARMFEEEFDRLKGAYPHFSDRDAVSAHAGYFAGKKEKGRTVFKDTSGTTKSDKEAYDLIMKDKERLLSFEEPVSFVFSHSALKEGWDNPNIFQICTLRETKSEMKKRQEIGRGLRLPLDVDGTRIHDPATNVLTVVANESYEEYVGSLQDEFDEAGYTGGATPTPGNVRAKTTVRTTRYLEDPDFLALWEKIRRKTKYNIELKSEEVAKEAIREIGLLDIGSLSVTVDKVSIYFDAENRIETNFVGTSVRPVSRHEIRIGDVAGRIAEESGLTRRTVSDILSRLQTLELLFGNPVEFIRSASVIVRQKVEDSLSSGAVRYVPVDDYWELNLFREFDSYLTRLLETRKSPFSHVEFDSIGERDFAEHLERSSNVKVYTKLPRGFSVETPIGEYRPDWAIVWHTEDGDKLYLVRETKFASEGLGMEEIFRNLRPDEQKKILFGKSHFEAIGADFALSVKRDLSDVI